MEGIYDGVIDSRRALTGMDGILLTDDGQTVICTESFQAQANFTNSKFQPCGVYQEREVPQSFSLTISFSEYVVEDAILFTTLMEALEKGDFPTLNFQGYIKGKDGQEERIIYRNVVPSGTVDIQNVSNGDTIKRQWSLFVNSVPKMQKYISY